MYSASVHCAYYSSFQYTKYILSEYVGINYQQQQNVCRDKDSHKVIYGMMCDKLIDDIVASNIYQGHYKNLKRLRIKADYGTYAINKEEAKQSLRKAEALNQLLHNKYEHK